MDSKKLAAWMIVGGLVGAFCTDGLYKTDIGHAKERQAFIKEQGIPKSQKAEAKTATAAINKANRKEREKERDKEVQRDAERRQQWNQQPVATSTPPLQLPPTRPPVREP